ncbi:MAG: efflux RND transporter periplasmic adaptor subunit [Sulfurovum sp.]|jgi:RND family efflux transporter MFP subunit|nr:efflux RND transporter periplasmic adaptor subunit [Sulfurovum sp.]
MNKKTVITIITIVLTAGLLIKGKNLLEERKEQISNASLPQKEEIGINLIKPRQGTLQDKASYLAHIEADKSITISTKLSGYIEHITVKESQKIHKGDLLVRIDDKELRSTIDGFEATYAQQKSDAFLAKSIYARNVKLYKAGGLAREQVDISHVAMQNKEAIAANTKQKIIQLNHQLSYLQILAPFDGEIDAIMLHEGDLATAGKPILSLSNGEKKLVFSYAAGDVPIKERQKVFIGKEKVGEIKTIYTMAQNGLMRAETGSTPSLPLPPGSTLTVEVLKEESEGCILPNDTIVHNKEGNFIMAYAEGKFIAIPIKILMQDNSESLIEPCPHAPVAQANESKLGQLPFYGKINISGTVHE